MLDLATEYPTVGEELAGRRARIDQVPLADLGTQVFQMQQFERLAAVGALLLDLDDVGFHHSLMRCAWAQIHLLRRLPEADREEHRYARTSRLTGFVDAVASYRFDLAREIATLSPRRWATTKAYEDDFCYAKLLHNEVLDVPPEDQVPWLQRFERVLDGALSPRFEICRVLVSRDVDAFDDAMEAVLDAIEGETKAQEESYTRNELDYLVNQHLSVEALALLVLARRLGFPLRAAYRYAPAEALQPVDPPLPDHTHIR